MVSSGKTGTDAEGTPMRLAVWGAGAIGGTVGAYLHGRGHDVVLVDIERSHVDAIRRVGVSLVGAVDVHANVPAWLPAELEVPIDVALLCVKSQHTREATEQLSAHLSPSGYVVSLQNGFNPEVIADVIGAERTVGALINNFHADYLEPGVISYGRHGLIVLGELNGQLTERVAWVRDALCDFDSRATDNVWGFLWAKEAYGAMLFATALSNASMADALADDADQPLYVALGREVLTVAIAKGVRPESFPGFETTAFMPGKSLDAGRAALDRDSAYIRTSTKTHSGIWRDLAVRKRRTEVDPQLGPVIDRGRELGVETPLISRLVELIHDVEEGRRTQGPDTLALLRAEVGV